MWGLTQYELINLIGLKITWIIIKNIVYVVWLKNTFKISFFKILKPKYIGLTWFNPN